MDLKEYKAAVEAMLFAYGEPLTSDKVAQVLEVEESAIDRLLYSLRDDYERAESGVCLLQLENRWQIATKKQYGDYIKKILDTRRNVPLSPAALETLTIVAYNQPVSRSFIEQVRGVDSSSSVSNLQEKGLIEEAGRLDLPGRPISFKTTDAFLRTFGLESLGDLPPLHEEDILSEESVVMEEEFDGQMMALTETDAEITAERKAKAEAKAKAKAELDATAAELKLASDAAASIVKNLKAAEKAQQEEDLNLFQPAQVPVVQETKSLPDAQEPIVTRSVVPVELL
ncbi:MAG: SMC-Scp complex subunit ScpB [Faecalibacterium sp.]